jgi:4-amino-4-deoxy-L-arabinose transferase-like glycosyltransferase
VNPLVAPARGVRYAAGLLVALFAVGTFVRVETLTKRPLWYDEAWTLGVVDSAGSLRDLWAASARDRAEHPVLFYAIAYAARQTGSGEKAIRVPALIFGVLSIPLLGTLGWRLFGPRTGLLSAFLLTFSVYHIDFSQDARSYTLLLFWSLLAYHGFLSLVRSRSVPGVILLAVSLLGSLYTHHATVFVAVPIGLAAGVLVARSWWTSRRFPWWLCGGFVAAAVLVGLGYWPQLAHTQTFLASDDLERDHTLALSGRLLIEVFSRWTFGHVWGFISAGLLTLGMVRTCRSWERSAILLPWVAMPFLVFGFVPFGKFFDMRFLITALPPFLILVGAGLDWIVEGAARMLARVARLEDRPAIARVVEALCAIVLIWSAAGPYRTFRRLEQRCSDFYHRPQVMRQERGFCRDHLVLSSLWRSRPFAVLRRYPPSDQPGSRW